MGVNNKRVGGIFEYSKENWVHEIRYHTKISHEETDLPLTFSLTLFKVKFNSLTIRYTTVAKNNIQLRITLSNRLF